MRKTVQEWMDANQHSNGPAKKKVAGLKRLKRYPGTAGNMKAAGKLQGMKNAAKKKRKPK
jgi:hypothetical protein